MGGRHNADHGSSSIGVPNFHIKAMASIGFPIAAKYPTTRRIRRSGTGSTANFRINGKRKIALTTPKTTPIANAHGNPQIISPSKNNM